MRVLLQKITLKMWNCKYSGDKVYFDHRVHFTYMLYRGFLETLQIHFIQYASRY